jgi:cGMP-dependent protein kinase 1
VGFVKAFHDKNYIYLVMEYIHGKELFDVIREVKTMSSEMVKYYLACLLLSVEYLHSNNIVYRDLKPENSVVDSKGKAFLIDMGTAKELNA